MKIEINRSSGIFRRVDDLGRIVIPREIRRKFQIREGDALEINLCENGIYIEKYQPQSGESLFNELLSKLADKKQEAILHDREQAEKISELEKFLSKNCKLFEEIN